MANGRRVKLPPSGPGWTRLCRRREWVEPVLMMSR